MNNLRPSAGDITRNVERIHSFGQPRKSSGALIVGDGGEASDFHLSPGCRGRRIVTERLVHLDGKGFARFRLRRIQRNGIDQIRCRIPLRVVPGVIDDA